MAKLGMALADSLGWQPQNDPAFAVDPQLTALAQAAPRKTGPMAEGGFGRYIAGAIGDMLLQRAGMQPVFAPTMAQRQQAEQEEAQWTRRQQSELGQYEQRKQIDQRYGTPDVPPMIRDVQAWMQMTPEQRAALGAMKQATAGDQFVTMSLPNGQFYAGPKSGLPSALGAGQQTPRPVGKLTPINGGPTAPPSGGFR